MSYTVFGRCPGAYRPMRSGDGLVVRVRPHLGRLTAAQVAGLCAATEAHGAGLIDLTSRANLQIRGVRDAAWPELAERLAALDLLDDDPDIEDRRNILVAPLWTEGDDTHRLARELAARLAELPALPAKVGFAIDAGAGPVLGEASADFRIERGVSRRLILRADGRRLGTPLPVGAEIDALIGLARWFAETGGAASGRMTRHAAALPAQGTDAAEPPAPARPPLRPGLHLRGAVHGLALGRVLATDLARAMADSGATALRVTPWRCIMLEGGAPGPRAGLEWDPDAAELRADACPGAPFCHQALAETRSLALALAPHVEGRLHVSGCAKGCAHPGPADVTLTATVAGFDLAFAATAGAPAAERGLSPAAVLARFGAA